LAQSPHEMAHPTKWRINTRKRSDRVLMLLEQIQPVIRDHRHSLRCTVALARSLSLRDRRLGPHPRLHVPARHRTFGRPNRAAESSQYADARQKRKQRTYNSAACAHPCAPRSPTSTSSPPCSHPTTAPADPRTHSPQTPDSGSNSARPQTDPQPQTDVTQSGPEKQPARMSRDGADNVWSRCVLRDATRSRRKYRDHRSRTLKHPGMRAGASRTPTAFMTDDPTLPFVHPCSRPGVCAARGALTSLL
jgi:hypothetical protein